MKIIYIKWFDASYYSGQYTTKEAIKNKDYVLESVGWLIDDSGACITYVNEWEEKDKTWRHIHHIPKVNIIRKKIIKI